MTINSEDASTVEPSADTPSSELPADVEALKAMVEEEREKSQRHFASWQRAAADYQNFKRRVEQDRSDSARFASEAAIINLLPIVDDFDRAFINIDPTVAGLNWVEGVRAIQKKLQGLLEFMGVTEIVADGEVFDPALHEAVSQGPGEQDRVIAVVQKGYKLGERVIRPSMVVVGNGSGTQAAGSEEPGT